MHVHELELCVRDVYSMTLNIMGSRVIKKQGLVEYNMPVNGALTNSEFFLNILQAMVCLLA